MLQDIAVVLEIIQLPLAEIERLISLTIACRFHSSLTLVIILITCLSWWISPQPARAEISAPGMHWGALNFPDQEPVFATGFSIFRFTEFNGEGERFNGIP
ncbi:MAG TPA: hypothetical protein PKM72_12415 [Nitrospirales bacterium]|nr:hypothetical protein [Nitrospirales bacterium]